MAIFFWDFLENFFLIFCFYSNWNIHLYWKYVYKFRYVKNSGFLVLFRILFCFVWHIWLLCVWLSGALLHISYIFISILNEINPFLPIYIHGILSHFFSFFVEIFQRFNGFGFVFWGLQWVFAVLLCRPCRLFK